MRLALIGYGKMGKIIEQIAVERGHDVVYRATSVNQSWKQSSESKYWDCAIEFTGPESVVDNLEHLIGLGIPTVCGSTGWNHELQRISHFVEEKEGTFIFASNFSVGVNLFFAANRRLAKLMNAHPSYKARIQEIHHLEKKDAPSGTAISTAEGILQEIDSLHHWELTANSEDAQVLSIEALRLPHVPGTHTVTYDSDVDRITLSHQAHNRSGFAMGAILSAEFLLGKKGIFTIEEVLNIQHD